MDTFVVRVWGPGADEEGETGLRGVVEHVASGWSGRFRSAEELVSLLRTPGPRVEGAGQVMGEA
jgi:hypothetical protein